MRIIILRVNREFVKIVAASTFGWPINIMKSDCAVKPAIRHDGYEERESEMLVRSRRHHVGWFLFGLAMSLANVSKATAQVQVPPAPTSEPFPSSRPVSPMPMPTRPSTTSPPPTVLPLAAVATDSGRAALEDRVRQLEAMVQQLAGQMRQQGASTSASAGTDSGNAATSVTPSASGGPSAPGQSIPPNPPPSKKYDSPAPYVNVPGNVKFGPGFEIRTDDEEFIMQFHNLTQLDYRGYQQGGQSPVHDTFAIPRQWFMFSGRLTKPVGYFVSLAHGFDAVSLLDVFADISYDPRLQMRVGRMKTPFTYEFLVEPIQGIINPERSVFFNNFGQNRDIGVMAFGRLFDGHVDYAGGVYNGSRNGVVALQDGKAVSALVNWKPFKSNEGSVLENFNVGGSVYTVNANHLPTPQTLRTAVPTAGNATIGVPFLQFNNNVRETGNQTFWDLHAAWFYKQLAVIGEWGSGVQDYSLTSSPQQRTALPVQSFYVQTGYLLTGETRSSVGIVKPLHPFDPKTGGLGAWELVTRYQYLDIGSQVFNNGLSDPNTGANRLFMTDLGFNWHMTQYVKVMFEWEHAEFNQPVVYAPGKRQLTSDLFLLRLQLFF